MQPNFSSKPRMISTGMAAPPETHSRSDAVLAVSAAGWWSMAAYMVGTPSKIVTLSLSMIPSALAGSNLGSSVSVPPAVTVALSPQVRPKTWNSGRQPMMTSSGELCSSVSAVRRAFLREAAVAELRSLGLPGCARGVEDHRVVAVGGVGRRLRQG